MNFLKIIILFLIEIIEKIQYRKHKDLYNHSDLNKIINILSVNNTNIKTDYGYVPIEEINLTKPFQIYILELENGNKLECADTHIVFTKNHEQKFVKDLTINDYVLCKENYIDGIKVKSIKKLNRKVSMFDLTVNTREMSYFSNDILSHNTVSASIVILQYCLFEDDKNVMIVANKGSTVTEIVDKIKKIYVLLPYFLKRGVVNWNQKAITFDNGCSIKTEKRTTEPAIGFTIDFLYLDEFAKIPNNIIRPYYTAVVPVVSSIKNSRIIITSTPDGFNLFHELLTNAERQKGDPLKNPYKAMRVYWWQIPNRRNTIIQFNEQKLEKYGLTEEEILNFLKNDYKYEISKQIENNDEINYTIKFDSDNEQTYIDSVRMIRYNNIPLPEVCFITNWQEKETKLIGSDDAFKQEYDLQFVASNKLLFDNVLLEKIKLGTERFDYIDIPNITKKHLLPYTDLKFIQDKPDLFDINQAKKYYIIYGIDLSEGLAQDYAVINIFRLLAKDKETIEKNKHKYSNIYDYLKLEQIGIFRNNLYSLKELAQLFYLIAFEVFDAEKSKVALEYNTYGGEFLAHLPNVFEQNNEYSNGIFFRYLHRATDVAKKIGMKVTGGDEGKKLLVKDYQTNVKKGNIIIHEENNIKELFVFTKKETSSGRITYSSDSGHDDTVMSVINLSSCFNLTQYKDIVDTYIQNELNGDIKSLVETCITEMQNDNNTPNLSAFGSGYKSIYLNNNKNGYNLYQKKPFGKPNQNNFVRKSPFSNF